MAQKISISLTDDIDPTLEAETTVEFSLDGIAFEIDLANSNAEKMRQALQPWIDAARKTGGRQRRRRPLTAGGTSDKEELKAIREWAASTGMKLPSRGRIPADVRTKFHAAQATPVDRVEAALSRAKAKVERAKAEGETK